MADRDLRAEVAEVERRLLLLEGRVAELGSVSPAELIKVVAGLRCALAVVERQVREVGARVDGRG
jgi:hypothetical protein